MTADLANLGAISERLDSLHDCPFDLDQARFDREAHAWLGLFLRPVWDAPEAQRRRRAVLIVESRLPVVEARLRLRRVTEVRIVDDQRIGRYSFNRIARIKGGAQLIFNEGLKIEMAFDDEPTGTYEEVQAADIRAVYRQLLLVQTGPALQFGPGASSRWAV